MVVFYQHKKQRIGQIKYENILVVVPQINCFNGGTVMKKIMCIVAIAALTCSMVACTRTNRQRAQNYNNQYATDRDGVNPGTTTGLESTGVNPNVTPDLVRDGNLINRTGYNTGYNTGNQSALPGNYDGIAQNNNPTGTAQGTTQITDENYNGGGMGSNQVGGLGNSQVNPGTTQGNPGMIQGNQGNAQGVAVGSYKDGTYTGEGDRNTRATVTITGGRISDIKLGRDVNGTFIQDENLNLGTLPGGGASSNVGQTTRSLANSMIQAQSPDIVTSTTGDTTIVDDMKLAVRRALDKARR